MSMKVHRGSPRAMHKSNACVGQMGKVSSHQFIYTSHHWLHFGSACGNCNHLAKGWQCLNGPKGLGHANCTLFCAPKAQKKTGSQQGKKTIFSDV